MGRYLRVAASEVCFAQGTNALTNQHSYLPYQPVTPTMYCAANDSAGNQYGNWTYGNPGCAHPYSGQNQLKAKTTVYPGATVHGVISY